MRKSESSKSFSSRSKRASGEPHNDRDANDQQLGRNLERKYLARLLASRAADSRRRRDCAVASPCFVSGDVLDLATGLHQDVDRVLLGLAALDSNLARSSVRDHWRTSGLASADRRRQDVAGRNRSARSPAPSLAGG